MVWSRAAVVRGLAHWCSTATLPAYANDPKYKKYTQQVEKCLGSFDSVHEWADFISFLKNLLKVCTKLLYADLHDQGRVDFPSIHAVQGDSPQGDCSEATGAVLESRFAHRSSPKSFGRICTYTRCARGT